MRKGLSILALLSAVLWVTASSAMAQEKVQPAPANAACNASEGIPAPADTPAVGEEAAKGAAPEAAAPEENGDSNRVWDVIEEPCGDGFPVGNPWTEVLPCGSCGAGKKVVVKKQVFCDMCRCVTVITSSYCKSC